MIDPWLEALRRRADRPPERPREPLCLDRAGPEIGSIEPELARRLVDAGLPLAREAACWRLRGDADDALAAVALWLHAHGLGGRWRGELLVVTDTTGTRHGAVERAAVRPLGIATFAVHLLGRTPDGAVWVQQRAFDKSTDPGLWDTLMGGLVAAGEGIEETLARETAEEAGIDLGQLQAIEPFMHLLVRRPVADGYMVEHIDVFEAVVPDAVVPSNRDGEVARFERLAPDALQTLLRADAFTLESALMLGEWLRRGGPAGRARAEQVC